MVPEEIIRRIKKALAFDGEHDWASVQKLIASGHVQIFHSEHGAWLTEVITTPLSKRCHVWIVAGELPEVMDIQPQVVAFAKEHGCKRMTATARLGWDRSGVSKAHGWKTDAVVLTQDL